jgi:plastocyanin
MRRRVLLAIIATTAIVSPWPARAATTSVSIKGRGYHPDSIIVRAGTIVQWSNDEKDLPFTKTNHTVTADDGSFDSGVLAPGDTFRLAFPTAGSFPYHCRIHANMTGLITVNGARASATPTASASARASASSSPKPRRSASPTPTASVSATASASGVAAAAGSDSGSSSAGAIISIAIVAIAVLVGAGYFVYVRFVRAPS